VKICYFIIFIIFTIFDYPIKNYSLKPIKLFLVYLPLSVSNKPIQILQSMIP